MLKKTTLVVLIIFGAFFNFGISPVQAIELAVNNVVELRDAVIQANGSSGPHIITLNPGDYILGGARGEDGGSTGDLDLRTEIILQGESARNTFLTGGGEDRVIHVFPDAVVTLRNLTVRGGRVFMDAGAGIFNNGGDLTLERCWITDNINSGSGMMAGAGVGLANFAGHTNVLFSTISDNHGDDASIPGGGIYNDDDGSLNILNSTISNNSAGGGAGIFDVGNGQSLLENSAIVFNSTLVGIGGGYTGGGADMTMRNSIIAYNTAAGAPSRPDCSGTILSAGFNIIGNDGEDGGCNIENLQPTDQIGTFVDPIDPLLGPLQNNGGPTDIHALLGGSPAIDMGDTANCPATDQRGAIRPFNGECDIGPFEVTNCGNGVLDANEVCDDGNFTNGDGCENTCQVTVGDPNASSDSGGGCSLQKSSPKGLQLWLYLLIVLSIVLTWRFKEKKLPL